MSNTPDPTTIARQIEEAGATPPALLLDLAADYEAGQALVGAAAFAPANRGGAAGQVRSEFVQAVRDRTLDRPFTKSMVTAAERASVHEQVALIWKELGPMLQREAAKVTRAAGDDLIEQLQPAFVKAATKLAGVVAMIGPEPIDARTILDSGNKAQHDAYRKDRVPSQDAVDRIARIRTTVLAPLSYGDRQPSVTWFLDPTHNWTPASRAKADEAWGRAAVLSDRFGHLLAAGLPLALNTHDQSVSIDATITATAKAQATADRVNAKERANEERRLRRAQEGTVRR